MAIACPIGLWWMFPMINTIYRGISLVRVTGIEPAHLAAREPNGRVTSVGLIPAP